MKNHLSPLVSPKASFTLSLIFFSLRIVRNLRVVNNTEKYITIKHVVVFSVIRRQTYEKLNANLNKVSLIFGLGITAGQNTPKEHINLMV